MTESFGTESCFVFCPYCGERIELVVDPSAGEQEYVEDCSVCCRPMIVTLAGMGDGCDVGVRREDE